jgi:hypothetical protein
MGVPWTSWLTRDLLEPATDLILPLHLLQPTFEPRYPFVKPALLLVETIDRLGSGKAQPILSILETLRYLFAKVTQTPAKSPSHTLPSNRGSDSPSRSLNP